MPPLLTAGRTHDRAVFSLVPGDQPAEGLDEVLARYRQLVPYVKLAGPTSFAPLIDTAMRLVIESGMQYHILVSAVSGALVQSSPAALGFGIHMFGDKAVVAFLVLRCQVAKLCSRQLWLPLHAARLCAWACQS